MNAADATILVVEDDPVTRTFLAGNLSIDGYHVLEAANVLDALQMIETEFPDLAIVDLGLPDTDGLELLSEVRNADRLAGTIDPDLPLLVLTGRSGELDRMRGFDRGCDDYVIKPLGLSFSSSGSTALRMTGTGSGVVSSGS
jgi:DNA-binding response OmpR family regulator